MSAETELLKLRPHRLEVDQDGEWWVGLENGERIAIPERYRTLFKLAHDGASLASLAASMAAQSGGRGRFTRLAKFLIFLSNQDILTDRRQARLAESLKPDSVWPESIAFEELASLELIRLTPRKPVAGAAAVLVAGLLVVAGGWALFTLLSRAPDAMILEESPALILLAFILSFSVARSVSGLSLFIFSHFFCGAENALRIRIDAVSVSLAVDDISQVRATKRYLVGCLGGILLLASGPFVLGKFAAVTFFFAPLVLLADLCPLRRSALTDWLRSLYNFNLSGERSESASTEKWVSALQFLLSLLWVTSLAWWLKAAFFPFARTLWDQAWLIVASRVPVEMAVMAGLLLLLAIVLVSFADDLIDALSGADSQLVNRAWRRQWSRKKVLGSSSEEHSLSRKELEDLPILRSLEPHLRTLVLENAVIRNAEAGDYICRQGDTDRVLYVLLSGEMAVARRNRSNRRKVVAILRPGAAFGEMAFFFGKSRTADVIATESARILAVPAIKDLTVDGLRSEELQFRIWLLQALVASPVFREMPNDVLDSLLLAGRRALFRGGEKVFSEGEEADSVYVIVQGQATVTQNLQPINKLGVGDVFGEISILVPGKLRTATVSADADLLTMKIEAKIFDNLLATHLPLAVELERVAEARLRRDQSKL